MSKYAWMRADYEAVALESLAKAPHIQWSRWTDEKVATLARLWSEGHSASRIAAAIGVTKNAVIGRAHRDGLPARQRVAIGASGPRRPSKWTPDRVAMIVKMRCDGHSLREVAAAFDSHVSVICRLHKHGRTAVYSKSARQTV
jgi:GcrA cell cycle regulator